MAFPSTPTQTGTINNFGTAVASSTLSATASGSLIVVSITSQLASGNSTSVTDNIGNTYTMVPLANPGTSQRHVEIWYCLSATAGVTTVTVNNSAGTNVGGTVTEWAGGAASLVTQASLNNASSGTPAAAAAAPTATGQLILGGMGYQEAVAGTRQDTLADGTYTAIGTGVVRGTTTVHVDAYKISTGTTSTGPSWTMSPAVTTGEVTAIFAPAVTSTNGNVTAVAATMTMTGVAPVITATGVTSGGTPSSMSMSANAPAVSSSPVVQAVTASMTLGATAPSVGASSVVNATVNAVAASMALSAGTPQVGATVSATVNGVTVDLTLTAYAPQVTITAAPTVYYLYTPPLWDNVAVMEGSLRYKIPTSTTTYKLNGQWYNVQSPGMGMTDGADYFFCTPTLVTQALRDEMIAANVPGTFS